jgi:hypothetical protein
MVAFDQLTTCCRGLLNVGSRHNRSSHVSKCPDRSALYVGLSIENVGLTVENGREADPLLGEPTSLTTAKRKWITTNLGWSARP